MPTNPTTEIYGWPYEDIDQAPGSTLNGGLSGADPILARAIEVDVNRIETASITSVAAVAAEIDALDARFTAIGAQRIATIDTGSGTNTTEFLNIPQTFRDLAITWRGQSDGSGEIDALAVRCNGDSGSNYKWVKNRNTAAGAYLTENDTTTSVHCGNVGTLGSAGLITIPAYRAAGFTRFLHGSSISLGQSLAGNIFATQAGGRWNSTSAIFAIRLWPSGQQWEGNPNLTLWGIP